jgi:uracil-DNA glycosylase
MEKLLVEIKNCRICEQHLPYEPLPIVQASKESRILIIGQAPGRKVQESGVPWDDASGRNLRKWLGVSEGQFYDPAIFALVPMGFCYPGTGKSGDLPPRPECAKQWHQPLLEELEQLKLTLLIGSYAQKYYLKERFKGSLTSTIQHYPEYLPHYLPLPHPSPRNNIWQKKNPWFKQDVLPALQASVNNWLS